MLVMHITDWLPVKDLPLYVNGMGFRAIEGSTGVNHNTVIQWFKQVGEQLPNAPEDDFIDDLDRQTASQRQGPVTLIQIPAHFKHFNAKDPVLRGAVSFGRVVTTGFYQPPRRMHCIKNKSRPTK